MLRRLRPCHAARIVAPLAALLLAGPAAAGSVTLSQAQLLLAEEVTSQFGGNGSVLSRSADDDGVLYEIQGGTIDFGKVALRVLLGGVDLTGFSDFGLHIEIVLAPNPVEVNPFVFTGPSGTIFTQDVPGVKVEGDAFDSLVPLAGIEQLDDVHSLGFQYFTAGDIEEPAAQTVLLRVSPLAGAVAVPEPATALLLGLGLAGLAAPRRTRSPARSSFSGTPNASVHRNDPTR